jgi:glutamate 5-kinase
MSASPARKRLTRARRIVVKVGSSTLTRDGRLRTRKVSELVRQIADLTDSGIEVVLVSSGAIAVGSFELGWATRERSTREKQAAAAVGQIGLAELYRRRFSRRERLVGQVLVTRSGLADRERFLNARHTLLELLHLGVVPVVNENDTVATEEILFGDNDRLSAILVNLVDADALVILTDVGGVYERKPVAGEATPPILDEVKAITPALRRAAGSAGSKLGSGGMVTKLKAAEMASRSGATTVICSGRSRFVLQRVLSGEAIGTLFHPTERMASRKHWIAFATRSRGKLVLDEGARNALTARGKSLLAAGIKAVHGRFRVGDSVSCLDSRGREFARGLVAYSSGDLEKVKGLKARDARRVLGSWNGDEVIHRDDLVVLET